VEEGRPRTVEPLHGVLLGRPAPGGAQRRGKRRVLADTRGGGGERIGVLEIMKSFICKINGLKYIY
jgi:hypothetical protein